MTIYDLWVEFQRQNFWDLGDSFWGSFFHLTSKTLIPPMIILQKFWAYFFNAFLFEIFKIVENNSKILTVFVDIRFNFLFAGDKVYIWAFLDVESKNCKKYTKKLEALLFVGLEILETSKKISTFFGFIIFRLRDLKFVKIFWLLLWSFFC